MDINKNQPLIFTHQLEGKLMWLLCNPCSISVDEVKAKVVLVHDEKRVLSEDEALVSYL